MANDDIIRIKGKVGEGGKNLAHPELYKGAVAKRVTATQLDKVLREIRMHVVAIQEDVQNCPEEVGSADERCDAVLSLLSGLRK